MASDIRAAKTALSAIEPLARGGVSGRAVVAAVVHLLKVLERHERELDTLRAETQELEEINAKRAKQESGNPRRG